MTSRSALYAATAAQGVNIAYARFYHAKSKLAMSSDAESSWASPSQLTSDEFSDDCSYYMSAGASPFDFYPPAREVAHVPRIDILVA